MPRKRRWRTTIQQQSATPPTETVRATTSTSHAQPTSVPTAELRHVGLIIAVLFTTLLGITLTLRTGSNQAVLDTYLEKLLS